MRKRHFISLAVMGAAAVTVTAWLARNDGNASSTPSLSFLHYTNQNTRTFGVIRLTNGSSRSWSYCGYQRQSPCYYVEVITGTGWKDDSPTYLDGSGFRPFVLGGGDCVSFLIPIPTNETWKAGLLCWEADFTDRLPRFAHDLVSHFTTATTNAARIWTPPIQGEIAR